MFDSYFDDTADDNIVDFSIQRKVLLYCVRDHALSSNGHEKTKETSKKL